MNWKDIFEIEKQLWSVCEDYIEGGSAPKDEEMEACYKAYAAVWEYRNLLQEKEKVRRAATQADKEIIHHPQYKAQRG